EGSAETDGIRGVFILKTFISIFALMMLAQGLSIAGRAALLIGGARPQNKPDELEAPFDIEHLESGL
ncbi:MAG: hypothetical protein L3J05_07370, partial [Robiginitomaculum sp.]|nr:hypothetical protein [Robiginitomaculum sp.]